MTTMLPTAAGTAPAARAAGRRAAHRARGQGDRTRRVLLHTPGKLRALLVALVLLSLAWGALGGWVIAQHSSAADGLVTVNERLTLDSRHMYQAIADADATITAAFLASSTPPLPQLQRYEDDLATARDDLSLLQAAGGTHAENTALASLGGGLSAYSGYVGEATAEYAMGYPLTGGSFIQVASEEAHLVLLPAANAVFTQENAALDAANSQATGLPTMIAALVLAAVTGYVLYRAQRWLTRRTNRVFSPGLVLASLLLVISVVWLAAGFLSGRSSLDSAVAHGSGPAQELALASIGVQQIRGDEVLNVISRSGNASFQEDFLATSKKTGPGSGSWLGDAAAAQQAGGQGTAYVAAAERDAAAWYSANNQVYALGVAANYSGERNLVVGGGSGNTSTGYNRLELDLDRALAADQAVFASSATAGANALDPLEGVVIAASLLMAAGCAWAVSRRLAEYR
jgi:ABC-type glycerol-3-phosphate transport system permease component